MSKETTTIVYPWIASMARGNELRYSLRSVETNFCPPVEVWLVGDLPDWYAGNFLPCPVYDPTLCLPRQDRAKKLAAVIGQERIAETFLWMMDDIYFIRPITLAQLRLPWICGEMQPERLDDWKPVREWTRQKKLTWQALIDNGKTLYALLNMNLTHYRITSYGIRRIPVPHKFPHIHAKSNKYYPFLMV